MNLLKDNYKYLVKDISDMEGTHKHAKKRKLIGLFKASFSFIDIEDYNDRKEYFNYVNFVIPHLYEEYKKKDLNTRTIIKELLKSRDRANILIARNLIKPIES